MMIAASRDAMNRGTTSKMLAESSSDSSSSSDDDYDRSTEQGSGAVKRSMMRYGKPITQNTMKVSYYIRIIAFSAALIAIPTELVLRNIVFDGEHPMIVNFQNTFSGEFWTVLTRIIVFFGEVLFVEAL